MPSLLLVPHQMQTHEKTFILFLSSLLFIQTSLSQKWTQSWTRTARHTDTIDHMGRACVESDLYTLRMSWLGSMFTNRKHNRSWYTAVYTLQCYYCYRLAPNKRIMSCDLSVLGSICKLSFSASQEYPLPASRFLTVVQLTLWVKDDQKPMRVF
jgi:hypothetical protein